MYMKGIPEDHILAIYTFGIDELGDVFLRVGGWGIAGSRKDHLPRPSSIIIGEKLTQEARGRPGGYPDVVVGKVLLGCTARPTS